ncbi:MAG: MBL fold metallo-hydrolase [Candidatus Parcubacteria bacterium]|nr:MBL fold metallo-hydrolase [Candidatus Parcubacteria bacterium]
MHIIWQGQTCFQIIVSQGKDQKVTLLTDPFEENIGLKLPKLDADLILMSQGAIKKAESQAFLVQGPGEYESKDVYVIGMADNNDQKPANTIYAIEAEDIKICFLGNIKQKELTAGQIEQIGEVDILMIPVGGGDTIGAEEAVKITNQLEPRIVIPMRFSLPKLNIKLDGVDKFLKAIGQKNGEALPKLIIKKKDMPEGEMQVVILQP